MKLSQLKRDKDLDREGSWEPIKKWPGVEVLVRPINNLDFILERDKLITEALVAKDTPEGAPVKLSNDEADLIGRLALARKVWVGWRGLEDDKGKPMKFDPVVAEECMRNKEEYWELQQEITLAASRVEKRVRGAKEKTKGNSRSRSGRRSKGAATNNSLTA